MTIDQVVLVDLDTAPEEWRQAADVLYSRRQCSTVELSDVLARYPGCSAVVSRLRDPHGGESGHETAA